LVDVNVLVPLMVVHHAHHKAAKLWFENLRPGEAALCRLVQLSLARLLSNRSVMKEYVLSASVAWDWTVSLMEDERVEFAAEPAFIDTVLPKMFRYSVPTHNLVTDGYLAAFAIAASLRLATFDKGFDQFSGLDLQLLPTS
jgi:toxin-antitoxin system PIN domain toxin